LIDTAAKREMGLRSILLLLIAYGFCIFIGLQVIATLFSGPKKQLPPVRTMTPVERQGALIQQRQDLADAPLNVAALKNIAAIYALDGDLVKSDELTVLISRLTLRDFSVQISAMQMLLTQKKYPFALIKLDTILRSDPRYGEQLFPLIIGIAGDDNGADAVTATLSQLPPWRNAFMQFASRQNENNGTLYGVLAKLRKMNAVVHDDELRPYLQYLAGKQQFETAYFVWLDFLSANDLTKAGLVFDGDFTNQPRNLIFDWNVLPTKNTEIDVVPRAGRSGDFALRLNFTDRHGAFANVFQTLKLEPGSYVLNAEARADKLRTVGGLRWQVSCLSSNKILAFSPKLIVDGPWQAFNFGFDVPVQNCETQRLALVPGSTAVLDQVLSGQVYYDSFRLERRP
jgi:hypothetical protein